MSDATATRPRVMGILNITPDSFSDGGVHFELSKAVHAAMQMESDGAEILDIGGESTRPGSHEVPADVEIARVVPVIEEIRRRSAVTISIDTRKARVAAAALDAGAAMVNDVSGLRHDPEMRALVASRGVPAIVMHMRGEPKTMQQEIRFDDVVAEVGEELEERRDEARAAGVREIYVDPGIGFGKTFEQNLELLANCGVFTRIAPVVIGASRKGFIGHLTGRPNGAERAIGSLATVAAALEGGAAIVRVHDVRETVDFLKVLVAIRGKRR
ncbi:MAG TPA: dihydropteroate synthase [Thermoanaerobaculia bacterium]|nr:dihydropteroate synthase [Thermoanaerobaculia bacterium]